MTNLTKAVFLSCAREDTPAAGRAAARFARRPELQWRTPSEFSVQLGKDRLSLWSESPCPQRFLAASCTKNQPVHPP
jgi:hypothetical protein